MNGFHVSNIGFAYLLPANVWNVMRNGILTSVYIYMFFIHKTYSTQIRNMPESITLSLFTVFQIISWHYYWRPVEANSTRHWLLFYSFGFFYNYQDSDIYTASPTLGGRFRSSRDKRSEEKESGLNGLRNIGNTVSFNGSMRKQN